jgi:hypothetical protein
MHVVLGRAEGPPPTQDHQNFDTPVPAVLYFRVDFLIMLATSFPFSRSSQRWVVEGRQPAQDIRCG